MNFLLIQDTASSMGGVETLVARLARWLRRRNHEVTVLVLENYADSDVVGLLPGGCRLVSVPRAIYYSLAFPIGFWHRQWRNLLPDPCDLILSFSRGGVLGARLVKKARFPGTSELVYVVHPRMLIPEVGELPGYYRRLAQSIPPESIVFANDECRRSHVDAGMPWFRHSRVVPLPVEPLPLEETRPTRPLRLVSVGRLEPEMKSYNWSFLRDFLRLAVEDDLVWEIYGEGTPEHTRWLREEIARCGGGARVILKGRMRYAEFPKALAGAWAFLGMGTAAVEAASMGLPAIVAVSYCREPLSYGLLQEVEFPCLGEPSSDLPRVPIRDVIHRLRCASSGEYSGYRKGARTAALRFSPEWFLSIAEESARAGAVAPAMSWRAVAEVNLAHNLARLRRRLQRPVKQPATSRPEPVGLD